MNKILRIAFRVLEGSQYYDIYNDESKMFDKAEQMYDPDEIAKAEMGEFDALEIFQMEQDIKNRVDERGSDYEEIDLELYDRAYEPVVQGD